MDLALGMLFYFNLLLSVICIFYLIFFGISWVLDLGLWMLFFKYYVCGISFLDLFFWISIFGFFVGLFFGVLYCLLYFIVDCILDFGYQLLHYIVCFL